MARERRNCRQVVLPQSQNEIDGSEKRHTGKEKEVVFVAMETEEAMAEEAQVKK